MGKDLNKVACVRPLLVICVQKDWKEMAKLLIDNNIDIMKVDERNRNAISYAKEYNKEEILELFPKELVDKTDVSMYKNEGYQFRVRSLSSLHSFDERILPEEENAEADDDDDDDDSGELIGIL